MTDQLEHDLRALLAARADAVTVDPAAGEQTIADRLRSGDEALADVVPLANSRRRRWPLAALAAAAAVVVLVAVLATRDDSSVETPLVTQPPAPAIFRAPGTDDEVAIAYLTDRLDVDAAVLELERLPNDTPTEGFVWRRTDVNEDAGGVVALDPVDDGWVVVDAYSHGASIDRAERDADSVTIETTGPVGSYVELSVHLLTGEAVSAGGCGGEAGGAAAEPATEPTSCDLIDEPIPAPWADQPLTVRFSVVTKEGVVLTLEEQLLPVSDEPEPVADDPTIGQPGDSAKDVAERVAQIVFEVDYVTTRVDPGRDSELVTLEGPDATVVADVMNGRVLTMVSPELALVLSDGFEVQDGVVTVSVPISGHVRVVGFDDALKRIGSTATVDAVANDPLSLNGQPWLSEATWVWLTVETGPGEALHAFGAAP